MSEVEKKVRFSVAVGGVIIFLCNVFVAGLIAILPGISFTGGLLVVLGIISTLQAVRLKREDKLYASVTLDDDKKGV